MSPGKSWKVTEFSEFSTWKVLENEFGPVLVVQINQHAYCCTALTLRSCLLNKVTMNFEILHLNNYKVLALSCKGKDDPMECGSYTHRGIILFEHAMEVVEGTFEYRIRQQIDIDNVQFGFMKGKGTTDAIAGEV